MSTITTADFADLERFFVASMANVEALRACQRHAAAADVLSGLARLVRTVEAEAVEHGYLSGIILGRWPHLIAAAKGGALT